MATHVEAHRVLLAKLAEVEEAVAAKEAAAAAATEATSARLTALLDLVRGSTLDVTDRAPASSWPSNPDQGPIL